MKSVENKTSKHKRHYLWAGIIGGFTVTTCCIAPIVLVLLGFGTAFGMMVMHRFHLISIISGIVFMLLLSLYLVKRKSGKCNMRTIKQNWKGIAIAAAVMIVSAFVINYLIVAPVAAVVYGNLPVNQKPMGNMEEMAKEGMTSEYMMVEEMNEGQGMHDMGMGIVPEGQGKKLIVLEIEGVFCGSCGPAIEYDVKSVTGVLEVERDGIKLSVTYDSDITNKDVIMSVIHDPYSAKIVMEKVVY